MIRDWTTPIWHAETDGNSSAPPARGPYVLVTFAAVLFAGGFCLLSLARHAAFQSHAFDLGNMDQALWNTLHGHVLRFTDMQVGPRVLTTRLAIHVEPFLLLLVPLYLVHAGPQTLVVVQACLVATGVFPAYAIARLVLGRPYLSLVFPVAYMLHPTLQNALLDDFHAVTLSSAFLLWAMYFLLKQHAVPYLIFCLLAISTKEEVGLVVACLGAWSLLRGRRVEGLASVVVGAGWFALSIAVIIPHFNPSGHSPYLARYAYLGRGIAGIARGAITHPGVILSTLASETRLQYLLNLFHPLGFTPVLAVPVLAVTFPVLLINMLSADSTMYSGYYQYSAEIVPVTIVASIVGIGWVGERAAKIIGNTRYVVSSLCVLVLAASLVDTRQYGFTPLADGYAVPTAGEHAHVTADALARIPAGAVVAAGDEIEPHVSDRRWVYALPTVDPANGPPADFIILDASVPSLPVVPRVLHDVVTRSLQSGYGIKFARDGILLLQRGVRSRSLPKQFLSFAFLPALHAAPFHAVWGPLSLVAIVVHPRTGFVNRARPAIGIETYWRVSGRLPSRAHIAFHLSPTYNTVHPAFTSAWTTDDDSPTWDWLPLRSWPKGRTVRSDSLGLIPETGSWGNVDVAVSVSGLGHVHIPSAHPAQLSSETVRIATIAVR